MEAGNILSKRSPLFGCVSIGTLKVQRRKGAVICMGGRTMNRKPLQKGRNLSIEAIQAVQALKRAFNNNSSRSFSSLDEVFESKITRLLKFDMFAVLRELLRQNQCLLALKVFEIIRKEHWYKPQVTLYADIIEVLAANGLFEQVQLLYQCLKSESSDLKPEIRGFNSLFKTFLAYELIELVVDCYDFMKAVDCEPDKSSFRTLINGLESVGERGMSAIIRQDAQKYYGESLEFLEEEEEEIVPRHH